MNRHQLLLTLLLLFSATSFSQKRDLTILLKDGDLNVAQNVSGPFCEAFNKQAPRYLGKAYALVQFFEIPTAATRQQLEQKGIHLIQYVPNYTYTASITGPLNADVLTAANARAVIELQPQQKMHTSLPTGSFPQWAIKVPGTVDVWVQFAPTFTFQEVVAAFEEKNLMLFSDELKEHQILALRIPANRLLELAAYPFIEYVQPAGAPVEPLNVNSRTGARATVLNAALADGGHGLNGEGVVIGIGDNGDVQQHVDFTGRLINRAAATHQWHGTHVTGIAAGAGIISEQARGFAPQATIVSQAFTGIINNAAAYVQDYNMVLTNNSYGNVVGCENNGLYDIYAQVMDRYALELPYLQHVFATGNSGNDECNPFPKGFGTVLGGFQTAKNTLSVGSTTSAGVVSNGSSKGPVRDGRLKPEITAMGVGVRSSVPTNSYAPDNGTSMASPAVTGGLALLYQRYRQLYNGADPKSALVKALVMNGAADKGNRGPDYSYGFGWMDLQRSLTMLEKTQFFGGLAQQGSVQTYNINIPENTAAVKVMLYWHDPAAALISSRVLVHNLDLEVKGAAADQLPQVLNAVPAAITQPSQQGADNLNNVEQVTIEEPTAGSYTIRVKGTSVAQNPTQEYFVVYDIIEKGARLTYPAAGEALAPGEKIIIQWDAYGNVSNSFYLQYSPDGGSSWEDIKTDISSSERQFVWDVPATVTDKAQVKLQNGSSVSTSSNFTILGIPQFSFSPVQCEGYISLAWEPVQSATGYDVMMLRGSEMMIVASTTATNYTFNSLSKDSLYWVTVRAAINSKKGRRADAKSRQPKDGNCSGNISDNDLKLEGLITPATGRAFTSTALNAAVGVTVQVKNLDDEPAAGFTVGYAINGGAWQTENVTTTLAPGANYEHTFKTTTNMEATGTYHLVAFVKNNTPDTQTGNDTIKRVLKHLPNAPLNVDNGFVDNLEAALPVSVQTKITGINNLDRYDFESSSPVGRVRTFVNTGMSYSGSKALVLDADRTIATGNTNFLTGTYNLQPYQAARHDLRLEFQYSHHGQITHANNKVWIRGSDTQPWIDAYQLSNSADNRGIYKKTRNIELSHLLSVAGQEFSSSFQIRWGQFCQTQTTDRFGSSGYSIDDIRLFQAVNDLQLLSILSPGGASCGLPANTPVTLSVYNSAPTTLAGVAVKYRVSGGSWTEEIIPQIGAKDTIAFTFSKGANFSPPGEYKIEAVVFLASDNYHDNDTANLELVNSPVISNYPYLQNFEVDKGHWYSGGKNNSWAWGSPASEKIKGAASGTRAWKTGLAGNHNDAELSYLYSPCFSVGALQQPALSFSIALDLEDCGTTLCDGAWVEYSEDGINWKKLPATASHNWYNKAKDSVWSVQNYTRWHVATTALPKGVANLRLRFVLSSDPAVTREGVAVDDIHIYDLEKSIYNGNSLEAPVTTAVSGANWVHFDKDGQRIASINAASQDLGKTDVKAYLFKDRVRSQNGQYYHGRNLSIQPGKRDLKDSVAIRFYFLDSETDSLVMAKGCVGCQTVTSAYRLGVTKYSDVEASFENGTLRDNHQGIWNFIAPQQVAIVPYDKGYYAEFKVIDFSEFWLNGGGLTGTAALPLKLLHFSAQKKEPNDVLLLWTTAAEDGVDGFDVELARSNEEVVQNKFQKLGTVDSKVSAQGEQQYLFTDGEPFKSGTRFYRLKIKEQNGSVKYSPVRFVQFTEFQSWQLYPNPSKGIFNLVYKATAGQTLQASVTDLGGRVLANYTMPADGNLQKLEVSLTSQPAGVYLLQVRVGDQKEVYKLFKQ